MPKLRVTGRMAALVGVSAAAATATLVAVAAPVMAAPATQLTTCTEQVRVRSQPSLTAPVIGNCAAGERVTVGETRNGFAHLVNKQGWASVDYINIANRNNDDGTVSGRTGSSTRPSGSNRSDSNNSDRNDKDKGHDSGGLLGGI